MNYLHLMYSGSHKGGVQSWAMRLPHSQKYKLTHSSIRKGSFSNLENNSKFVYEEFSALKVRNAQNLILSDYRAALLGTLISLGQLNKKKVYVIIHSNRRKIVDLPILYLTYLLNKNTRYLFTTIEQLNRLGRFTDKNRLVNLFDDETGEYLQDSDFTQNRNVMYFGRLSIEKKLGVYLDQIGEVTNRNCYFFGDGSENYIAKLRNHEKFEAGRIGWFSMSDVIFDYEIGFIVIPNKDEGISLVTAEAIARGVIPICKNTSALSTLGLPEAVFWNDCESLNDVINRIESLGAEDVYKFCKKSLSDFMMRVDTLHRYLEVK